LEEWKNPWHPPSPCDDTLIMELLESDLEAGEGKSTAMMQFAAPAKIPARLGQL
jgi:hypothetical protein